MSLHTQCLQRIRWPRPAHSLCGHINVCRYGSSHAPPEAKPDWFLRLRAEMLGRPIHITRDYVNTDTHYKLQDTLKIFMGPNHGLRRRLDRGTSIVPFGHHLVWFNSFLPEDQLLPDGTDPLQSPGGPWVRRMWAGGEVVALKNTYHDHDKGFIIDRHMSCAERIQDVQLKGDGDTAKIFVTIERRYASLSRLERALSARRWKETPLNAHALFRKQIVEGEEWGDAILKEERILVFIKEKTPAEQKAIAAGELLPVKYLDKPPGEPDFSHTLTPTRALLFRYSALTFNAHLIHLDRDYARNVEGHRNLLVHGPLSLTLMLQVMSSHINKEFGGKYVIHSIKYKNLAPLYCDEQMRICIMKNKALDQQASYIVWIEGPTGGVAIKGKVLLMERGHAQDRIKPSADSRPEKDPAPVNIRRIAYERSSTEPTPGANDGDDEMSSVQAQMHGGAAVADSADQLNAGDNGQRPIIRKDPVGKASELVRKIDKPVIRKTAMLEERNKNAFQYGLQREN